MEMNGQVHSDRHIKVSTLFANPDYKSTVLVASLPLGATEEKLWRLFEAYGPVVDVNLMASEERKSVFASVTFASKEGRRRAVADRIIFEGCLLTVKRRSDPSKRALKVKKKIEMIKAQIRKVPGDPEDELDEEYLFGVTTGPNANPHVEFKNVHGYLSKEKQRRCMEEVMGKRKPKLIKELSPYSKQAHADKKQKRADREKREKENRERVNHIKLKIKKI